MKPTTETVTPTYRVVTVTHELAQEWLKRNTRNRKLNPVKVARLVGAMKRPGEWVENGDTIRFSVTGVLLDGQTRLAAIVACRIAQRFLVVENLPDEAQDTIDINDPRTLPQMFAVKGILRPADMAALARAVFRYEAGQIKNRQVRPTPAQAFALIDKHPEFIQSIRIAESVRRQLPVSPTTLALSHWIFVGIEPDDAAFFFDRLRDGQGLVEGDAILALRKAILTDLSRPQSKGRMNDVHLLALTIKAWNAYRKGRTVVTLKYTTGGAHPEQFPTPE